VLRVGLPADYAVGFLQRVMNRLPPGARPGTAPDRLRFEPGLDDLRRDELDFFIAMSSESCGNVWHANAQSAPAGRLRNSARRIRWNR
jgi:hypothetical protein